MTTSYYRYSLELRAPVIASAAQGDANSSDTLDFIPGSTIRGALAAAILRLPAGDAIRDDFQHLILSGEVRFLHAHRAVGDTRTLPTPLSYRRQKYRANPQEDAFIDTSAFEGIEALAGLGQLEPLGSRFVDRLGYANVESPTIDSTSRVHHQRDRNAGRATSSSGAIFRYESLAARQVFRGIVAIASASREHTAVAADIVRLLENGTSIGRSRQASYGGDGLLMWDASPASREYEAAGAVTADIQSGEVFRLVLASDYAGRSQSSGQIDPRAIVDELARRLPGAKVLRQFSRFRHFGGFNRKWGLELPQGVALEAGSVLVLQATTRILLTALLDVEHSGLGERRIDGFGRVVLLEAPSRVGQLRLVPRAHPSRPVGTPPLLIKTIESRLLDNALRVTIEQAAASIVDTCTKHHAAIPTRSLLGRLRVPLRQRPEDALRVIRSWITAGSPHALREPAMKQLRRMSIDGLSLNAWLDAVSTLGERGPVDVARRLGYQRIAERIQIDSSANTLGCLNDAARAAVTRVQLIDTVLAGLSRQKAIASKSQSDAHVN